MHRIRVRKISWNGNDGEVLYDGGEADHRYLRQGLLGLGFRVGQPYHPSGSDAPSLRALPVVKTGCSLLELYEAWKGDPRVELPDAD